VRGSRTALHAAIRRNRACSLHIARVVRHLKLLPFLLAAACTSEVAGTSEDQDSTAGASIQVTDHLSGCQGHASSTIPSNGVYYMTTFGGGADTQPMACGGTADGKGYYAASRQRYGCGAKLQVEANGKCVVLAAMDYGPDVCVESAAGGPILDMSPAASKILWNVSGAGWSDRLKVDVTEVPSSTPLGPCTASSGSGSDSGSGSGSGTMSGGMAGCSSATLDSDVDDGTCVQAATDGKWYQCDNGNWDAIGSTSGCSLTYGWCSSATLGKDVPPRTCVQSASSKTWFQCNGTEWVTPVDTSAESGPLGACSTWNAL
jgi:hypothetical protein